MSRQAKEEVYRGARARAFLKQEEERLIREYSVDPETAKLWARNHLHAYNRSVKMELPFDQPRRRNLPA